MRLRSSGRGHDPGARRGDDRSDRRRRDHRAARVGRERAGRERRRRRRNARHGQYRARRPRSHRSRRRRRRHGAGELAARRAPSRDEQAARSRRVGIDRDARIPRRRLGVDRGRRATRDRLAPKRRAESAREFTAHAEHVGAAEPLPAPVGTSVRAARLFANVPVRREYLRSARREFNRISAWLSSFALAYPERDVHASPRRQRRVGDAAERRRARATRDGLRTPRGAIAAAARRERRRACSADGLRGYVSAPGSIGRTGACSCSS